MLDKSILSELFSPSLFYESNDRFLLKESDKKATLTSAEFVLNGASFLYCTEKIWSASEELFAKQTNGFEFKKKCDGLVLCKTANHNYVFWIELKSSVNEIWKKAVYQLSGCYVKAKSHFHNFALHYPDEYEELAIVVTGPEKSEPMTDSKVVGRRDSFEIETPENIYKRRYRRDGNILLRGKDFGIDSMHLAPKYN